MKIIFYCVGKDVSSGEKNRIILHEDTVIFFICSQCVFTTAARRVDNKFILNTKGKWCGAAQNLLQQIYITILWVFTFMAETGEACIITQCHNEGSIRKEAQIRSHWYGEICVSTLSVLSDWDSYQVKHFFGFHQILIWTPAPVPSAQRNKENCVAIVTLSSFQFGLRQHWHLVVAPRTCTWVERSWIMRPLMSK